MLAAKYQSCIVQMVLGGGPTTLETVRNAVLAEIPIIVFKGTGRCVATAPTASRSVIGRLVFS